MRLDAKAAKLAYKAVAAKHSWSNTADNIQVLSIARVQYKSWYFLPHFRVFNLVFLFLLLMALDDIGCQRVFNPNKCFF